jgi:hypothetical protein
MFPDTCWCGHFFLSGYMELVPKICPQLSVTPCIDVIHNFSRNSCCICTYWSRRLFLPTRGLGTASPLRFSDELKLVSFRLCIAAVPIMWYLNVSFHFILCKLSSLFHLTSCICGIFMKDVLLTKYVTRSYIKFWVLSGPMLVWSETNCIYLWLYSPLLDLGCFFSSLILLHSREDSLDGRSAGRKAAICK